MFPRRLPRGGHAGPALAGRAGRHHMRPADGRIVPSRAIAWRPFPGGGRSWRWPDSSGSACSPGRWRAVSRPPTSAAGMRGSPSRPARRRTRCSGRCGPRSTSRWGRRLAGQPPPGVSQPAALRLWGWQLLVNAAWTPAFFGLHQPWLALAVLVLLLGLVGRTLLAFRNLHRGAALLMVPYALWSCCAMPERRDPLRSWCWFVAVDRDAKIHGARIYQYSLQK